MPESRATSMTLSPASCVAMTAIGKGNVPGAMQPTLLSLVGVFLTPFILSLDLLTSRPRSFPSATP